MADKYFEGIGRRKTSTARVRVFTGDKPSTVNGKTLEQYFTVMGSAKNAAAPFDVADISGKYYFTATVNGGGITGQLDAIRLGLSRAIYKMDPDHKPALRKQGLVTRDPRAVERKKYNHVKARKSPQFSKR